MNNRPDFIEEESIDIKKYIFKILSNWYWFAITIFISVSIAYLLNRYADPVYQVNSSLLVNDNEKPSSYYSNEMIQGLDLLGNSSNIQNQIGILKSYELNQKVISELEFDISYYGVGRVRDPELYKPGAFKVILDTNHVQTYNYPIYITINSQEDYQLEIADLNLKKKLKFGETYENEYFKFQIIIRDPMQFNIDERNKYYFIIHNQNQLANAYRGSLDITLQNEDGTILTLTTRGYVPAKACDYLNKLTEVYIRSGLEEKNSMAKNTIRFIDEQINAIVDSLSVTENVLQEFRTQNRIIDINQEGRTLYDQYEKLEGEKAALLVEQKYYDYLKKYMFEKQGAQSLIVPTAVGVNDQLLVNSILRLNNMNEQKMALQSQSVKSNPKLELVESQIEGLKALIVENVNNLYKTNQIAINDLDEPRY